MNLYLCFIFIIITVVSITELNNYYNGGNYAIKNNVYDDYDDYNDYNNMDYRSYTLSSNGFKHLYIKSIVEKKYNEIYNRVIDNKKKGNHYNYFAIACIEIKNKTQDECREYDGYQKWSKLHQKLFRNNKEDVTNFIPYIIRNRVLHKLKNLKNLNKHITIRQIYKNCCDYYTIY
jgi:hypothetical protein